MNKLEEIKKKYYRDDSFYNEYVNELEKENENLKCCGNCGYRAVEKEYNMHKKSNQSCKEKEWKPDNLTQNEREI